MKRFIIEISDATQYKYNVWAIYEGDDHEFGKDTRIFCSDNLEEFVEFVRTLENIEEE